MELVTERKLCGYIISCEVKFRGEDITRAKIRCCMRIQWSINSEYMALLSGHAAKNKEQKFVKQKVEELG